MTDDKIGWCQWREGDNLHEQRPAAHNVGGYVRSTSFGYFSRSGIAFREMWGRRCAEAYNESLLASLVRKE